MQRRVHFPRFLLLAVLAIATVPEATAQVLDASFGINGMVPYGGPLSNSQNNRGVGNNSVIQPDGKIVVAMDMWDPNTSDLHFYTYRYYPDGSPDSTFGDNGVSRLFVGDQCKSHDLRLEPDGRIIVIGQSEYCVNGICGAPQFIMMRLLPNGELDTSFGNAGHLITTDLFGNQGSFAIPHRVAHFADGRYFIGGRGIGAKPFVARLMTNGYPDPAYASNGSFTDTAQYSVFKDLIIDEQQRGHALTMVYNYVDGTPDPVNPSDALIIRLTPQGTLDPTFADNGRLRLDLMSADNPMALSFMPDGRLLLLGDHWSAFIGTNGELLSGPHYIVVPGFDGTLLDKALPLENDRIMLSGKVHHYINGNWQEQALLGQVDAQGQFRTDFNQTGYLALDHGAMGPSGWQGKLCRLFDLDKAVDGSVVATGYRNPNPGHTLRSLYLIRLLDVPGSTSSVSVAEHVGEPSFSVHPNPTEGSLQVVAPHAAHFVLYNALGGEVQKGFVATGRSILTMDDALPMGLYFLHLHTTTGNNGEVIRIVKQ